MRSLALLTLLLLAACGADGLPEPVTPGIEATEGGVLIDVSGTATIGVSSQPF